MDYAKVLLPPRPDALPLAKRGPHGVGVRTEKFFDKTRERPLTVECWYPTEVPEGTQEATEYGPVRWHGLSEPVSFAGRALRGREPSVQNAPTVIYAHGAPGSRLQATYLCEHLASHGFFVAAIDATAMTYADFDSQAYVSGLMDRPLDVPFILDELAHVERFQDTANTEHAAIIGYSFGGYTALASCGAGLDFEQLSANSNRQDNIGYALGFRERLESARGKQKGWQGDERLRAAFVMAPWNAPILALAQVSAPLFVAVGELDTVAPSERDARRIFEHVSSQEVHLLTFERGGHNLFTNPSLPETRLSVAAWAHVSDPVWDKERAHDIVKHAVLAFLRRHLLKLEQEVNELETLEEVIGVRLEAR